MPSSEPEKGDKVSWPWGGGAPGGEVVDKKTEGEITIKSQRGNTIKKNASPGNPAVHVKRSGNDVVKRASELNVEKKAAAGGGEKRKNGGEAEKNGEDKKDKNKKYENQAEESDQSGGGGLEVNDEGKEVKPGGKERSGKGGAANKKQKVNGAKDVKMGQVKKSGGGGDSKKAKEEKKPSKPREEGSVSARTRSRA